MDPHPSSPEAAVRTTPARDTHAPMPATTGDFKHVMEVLKDFDTLMIGTCENADADRLHLRPMAVAKLEDDGRLCFLTSVETSKVFEAQSAGSSYVTGQSSHRFVALSGRFELSQDRAKIHALWKKPFEVWFEGPDDPTVVLMVFHPHTVEFWDAKGLRGLKYLFESAKALVTGEKPGRDAEDDQHKVISMHTH